MTNQISKALEAFEKWFDENYEKSGNVDLYNSAATIRHILTTLSSIDAERLGEAVTVCESLFDQTFDKNSRAWTVLKAARAVAEIKGEKVDTGSWMWSRSADKESHDKIKQAREDFSENLSLALRYPENDKLTRLKVSTTKTILLALTALEKLDGVELEKLEQDLMDAVVIGTEQSGPSPTGEPHITVKRVNSAFRILEAARLVAEIKGGKENV